MKTVLNNIGVAKEAKSRTNIETYKSRKQVVIIQQYNGRNMKHITIVFTVVFFLAACIPQQAATDLPVEPSTETPTPLSTPTAAATLDPLANTLLYSDDFSSAASGWEAPDDDEVKFFYEDEQYHIQAASSDQYYLITSGESFRDAVLTVDVQHLAGDDSLTAGMVFWRYSDNGNFYALVIFDNGTYTIHRYLDGVYGQIKLLTASPALKPAGESNKVTIAFHNDKSDLYFNDQFVFRFTDTSLWKGEVGMGAYPDSSSDVQVAYDNLSVYKYDPANEFTPPNPELTPTPSYNTITWDELVQFLTDDHTNWNDYDLETYNCLDYAVDVVANARQQNIKVRLVAVAFVGQEMGHAFVEFETSDRGIIFVEPQKDNTYSNVGVGIPLCDDWGKFECMGVVSAIEYFSECDHSHNCTVELQ